LVDRGLIDVDETIGIGHRLLTEEGGLRQIAKEDDVEPRSQVP
jgi:hypothetical protein